MRGDLYIAGLVHERRSTGRKGRAIRPLQNHDSLNPVKYGVSALLACQLTEKRRKRRRLSNY